MHDHELQLREMLLRKLTVTTGEHAQSNSIHAAVLLLRQRKNDTKKRFNTLNS